MKAWRRPAALAAALALAVLVSACGDTVIDNSKAEGAIKANLEKSLHERITSVDCPSSQKVEAGTTFTCTIDFPQGKQEIATLKIRDKDADISLVGLKPSK